MPAFSRFLQTAALTSGQILNFTSIASDAAVPATTVREYYQVLEDTFLGFMVPAWTQSQKRKALSSAKFYLFDLGVRNTLAGITSVDPQSDRYGNAFEHFIALELRAYLSYRSLHMPLNYWRTTHGHEVDFIIGGQIAIEVKAANKVQDKYFNGLRALAEEKICKHYILVSHDKINRKQNEFEAIYWEDFLIKLWTDQLIKN